MAAKFVLYRYAVSLPAASVFAVLFAFTTGYHLYQLFRTKRWNMVPFIIGGLMSVGGYAARIKSHYDPTLLGAYIAQSLLLLVAPVLFAATIYMTLSSIIITSVTEKIAKAHSLQQSTQLLGRSTGGYDTLPAEQDITAIGIEAARRTSVLKIPVAWITRIFVTADIIALFTQGGGGGLLASGDSDKMKTGENIVLGGLLIQIIAFTFFLSLAIAFDLRQRKEKPIGQEAKKGWKNMEGWRKMLYALYTASGLLLVRNTFRVIEYVQGNDGYLMRNEVWLYIFDGALMLALMVMLNAIHPGEVLVGDAYDLAWQARKGRRRDQADVIEMGGRPGGGM